MASLKLREMLQITVDVKSHGGDALVKVKLVHQAAGMMRHDGQPPKA